MPKIAIYKYLVFYIVAYDLKELYHLHVIKTRKGYGNADKIWMDPVEVFDRGDLTNKELLLVLKLIENNEAAIKNQIAKFAKGEKIKPVQLY